MNRCTFMGRLTRDVESRDVGSSTVYNFGLAVGKTFKKQDGTKGESVVFLDLEAWDSGGETIQKYFSKGDGIVVECEVKQDTWEKDGQKHSKLKFRVNQFYFPLSKPSGNGGGEQGKAASSKPKEDKPGELTGNGSEDIPF